MHTLTFTPNTLTHLYRARKNSCSLTHVTLALSPLHALALYLSRALSCTLLHSLTRLALPLSHSTQTYDFGSHRRRWTSSILPTARASRSGATLLTCATTVFFVFSSWLRILQFVFGLPLQPKNTAGDHVTKVAGLFSSSVLFLFFVLFAFADWRNASVC